MNVLLEQMEKVNNKARYEAVKILMNGGPFEDEKYTLAARVILNWAEEINGEPVKYNGHEGILLTACRLINAHLESVRSQSTSVTR